MRDKRCKFLAGAMAALAIAVSAQLAGAAPPPGAVGFSAGAFQVGTTTRLAMAPTVSIHLAEPVSLTFQDTLLLFPGPGKFGFNNQTSVGLGYFSNNFNIDVGASFSQYWMDVCGTELCGRVIGVAPGARAKVSYFMWESIGLAVNADIGWYGGRSLVLPDGLAFMGIVGPVFRWKK